MTNIEKYVARQTFMPAIFEEQVIDDLGLVVTIPAYAELELIVSLNSLLECDLPDVGVEVIVVINHPINADVNRKEENNTVYKRATEWAKENSNSKIQFLVSHPIELPKKHAGAGLARKIAMDEAVRRLESSGVENPIIAAFDADSTCSKNYLTELRTHFKSKPKSLGCSINFEHPIKEENQTDFEVDAIIQYELHLRYYQAALRFAKHPHAEFTVGSSMAVTRDTYVAQGGMNRRKAGEDFWFMLKLMMAGNITAITESTVYPSARESFRVPFGTGRAMTEMTEKADSTYYTASFESFKRLKAFLLLVDDLYKGSVIIEDELTQKFLALENWEDILDEIRLYTSDKDSFKKRFYRWFNSFMVMKYFHFMRDEGLADVPVNDAANHLLSIWEHTPNSSYSPFSSLQKFRAKKRV
jgi:cellulose synthase/poly-beta-1,6-N-acetylglucosamine synthase-like glycosyltransferase